MYYVRPIFDVDYYTRENRQADVLGSVQYPMSIIARERNNRANVSGTSDI